ncbi:MAG TPA: hypothetical protein VMF52_16260 [Steroidobacteraceae bacterium]|nr:hypothetical protein [Steroidobacteraceae bacterium]
MNRTFRPLLLWAASAAMPIALTAAATSSPANSPLCTTAEYHQLDFWLGDWDTLDSESPTGPSIARARIEPIAQGCALHELYEQTDGLIGDSILSYDPVRKQWQQTWVTNRGSIMVLWGNFKAGALVLEGEMHQRDGTSFRQRITWEKQDTGVREWAVSSRDGGKTWSPAFDVSFVKRGDR